MGGELIVCIVNSGFADLAMDSARSAGARGGTIINARGAARPEAEKKYKVSIHTDKDLILIVAEENHKNEILHALYNTVGFNHEAQGFIFALPVDEAVGFSYISSNTETLTEDDD